MEVQQVAQQVIYTIGYGNRTVEDFIRLLHQYNIALLVDVRTIAASRFQPSFNRDVLQQSLVEADIAYVFSGDTLGGRPADEELRTNGYTDYDKIRQSGTYRQGLQQLISIAAKQTTCIMCSELNPDHCHRKRLIGENLFTMGVLVSHIDERGRCLPHTASAALF